MEKGKMLGAIISFCNYVSKILLFQVLKLNYSVKTISPSITVFWKMACCKIIDKRKVTCYIESKISMDKCNTILSAYTIYRHLEWFCTQLLRCDNCNRKTLLLRGMKTKPHSSVSSIADFRTGYR